MSPRVSFLFLLTHFLVSPINGQSNDGLQSCLTTNPDLTVVTSSDFGTYKNVTQPFNLRFTPSPIAIVYPTSPEEVSHVVACASDSGLNVSARSGGHSYAAYGLSGNVVVDLSKLKNLTVDATGKAISQTGLHLGELAEGIWNQGRRALPHGSCAHVGTGGHPLFGGFGYFSRVGGLLLDRIVSAEVVLANGTIVTASDTSNVDLFWALRGAGPSFGIVTSWTFATFPAPITTVFYQITFSSSLTEDQMTLAFISWQQFATMAPDELAMSSILSPAGADIFATFQGTYYGDSSQFDSVIEPLLRRLPSTRKLNATALSWLDNLVALDEDIGTGRPDSRNTFFAKSLVTTQPSTNASIASWMKYLFGPGTSSDTEWFVQVDLYGGAVSSVSADATAFAHRDAFLVYQLYASSPSTLPPYPTDGIAFVGNMLTALDPSPKAAYPNYIDPTLSADQWRSLYFADHINRLEQIKRDVDPKNVFNFEQAITPASSSVDTPSTSVPTVHSNASSSNFSHRPIKSLVLLSLFIMNIFGSFEVSGTMYL